MSLVLVGLPMSGKTTIGKALAAKLKRPFIDTDDLITKAYAKIKGKILSPREIYLQEGEKFFRLFEKLQIASLSKHKNVVVSVGGGGLSDLENTKVLSSLGKIIYLQAEPNEVWQRTATCGIPAFLSSEEPEKTFYDLAKKRVPLYESVATITVSTRGLAKEEIIESIMRKMNGE